MAVLRRTAISLTTAVSLLLAICPGLQADSGTIPVTLHSRAGVAGIEWPLTFGVPFPEGVLTNNANVRLLDPNGIEVPIQIRTTGNWISGSIRWVLIDTQRPLPTGQATYSVQWGDGVSRTATDPDQVTVTDGATTVTVDTGPLQFTLTKQDMRIFSDINVLGTDQQMHAVFPAGQTSDLLLQDDPNGTIFLGSLATSPDVTIEEAGPLRVSIKLEGWMRSAGGANLGRRIVRVQAFAGKRWLRIYDTWVNTGDTKEVAFRNVAFHLPFNGTKYAFPGTAQSAPRDVTTTDYLLQYESDKYEIVADSSVLSTGQRSDGRVDLGQGDTAFSVAIRNFWQMCPAEIEINQQLLRIHAWPRHGKAATHLGGNMTLDNIGHLWWVHEGEVLDFETPPEAYTTYFNDAGKQSVIHGNAFGIATTSEYLLDFHGETANPNDAATTRDANPMFVVDPQWLADSQAFWNIAPWREPYLEVEQAAAAPLDFFVDMWENLDDYGMWNYGAFHKGYLPTLDEAKLHRHWMAFHHGGPRWPWLVFARSGDPKYFDFAETNARHNMDVATSNWEELAYNQKYFDANPNSSAWLSLKYLGGLCKYHGLQHWMAGSEMGYNSAGDYALWYYYMTGYQRAWDVAMNHAEFLLRWNAGGSIGGRDPSDPARSNSGRNGMGRGAMATTFYRATGDIRHKTLADGQMNHFRGLTDSESDQDQGFREIFYSPFVERYYEVTGDATLEPYIINWAQGWMDPPFGGEGENCCVEDVLPAGREHWAARDTWYNMMALGYQLTGDEEFLQYGLQQARLFLDTRGTNADPILEDVALGSYPGIAGYTAQQFGHFVKALEEYEQSTGQTLTVPALTDTPLVGVPYKNSEGSIVLVFHVRKAAGERVEIPFTFRTLYGSDNGTVTVEDPNGVEIVNQTINNTNAVLAYDLVLPEASAAGDYRVSFNAVDTLYGLWPPREGMWTKVVLESPFFQAQWGERLYFMPRVFKDNRVRLYTSVRPDEFQTHRLYRPDGSEAIAKTLQLGPPHYKGETYLVGEVVVEPKDQAQLWMCSYMSNGKSWVEGDVYPVIAFRPDEFFVPEQFLPEFCGDVDTAYKLTDIDQDCYVNGKDLALFIAEWLQCTHPADPTCDL